MMPEWNSRDPNTVCRIFHFSIGKQSYKSLPDGSRIFRWSNEHTIQNLRNLNPHQTLFRKIFERNFIYRLWCPSENLNIIFQPILLFCCWSVNESPFIFFIKPWMFGAQYGELKSIEHIKNHHFPPKGSKKISVFFNLVDYFLKLDSEIHIAQICYGTEINLHLCKNA